MFALNKLAHRRDCSLGRKDDCDDRTRSLFLCICSVRPKTAVAASHVLGFSYYLMSSLWKIKWKCFACATSGTWSGVGVCILYTYYGKSGQTERTGRPLALKRGNGNGVSGRRTWAGCKHLVAPFKYANGYSKNYFIIRQAPTYTHFLEHKLFIFLYFLSTLFSYFSYIY